MSPRSVRLLQLPGAALAALADGDGEQASSLTGIALGDFLPSEACTWLWRLRLDQVRRRPQDAPWVARAAVSVPDGVVVGHAGFHGAPDDTGMVEVAYTVDPAHRRLGFARAMLTVLLEWAAAEPAVTRVRASISPDNAASLATIRGFGFERVGEQWDEEDGLEVLFEVPVRGPGARTSRPAGPR